MRAPGSNRRCGRFVIAGLVLLVSSAEAPAADRPPAVSSATSQATTQPAKTPNQLAAEARKSADDAVKAAIDELVKEFQSHHRDPSSVALRTKGDYFSRHPSPAATTEAIVAALRRSLPGDVESDVYVKWQLLSGIPGKVDAKLAPQLLAAYREAPTPGDRPGLDQADKKELDVLIRSAKQSDIGTINGKLQKQVEAFIAASAPILEYRDDLYAHLPSSQSVLVAGLEDGVMRASHGLDADRHTKAVLASCQTWAVMATPSQIVSIADALGNMATKMGGAAGGKSGAKPAFPPSYYAKLEWDEKGKRLVWREGQAKFSDAKALAASSQQLEQTAATLSQLKR
jgi:hypothetical protein